MACPQRVCRKGPRTSGHPDTELGFLLLYRQSGVSPDMMSFALWPDIGTGLRPR